MPLSPSREIISVSKGSFHFHEWQPNICICSAWHTRAMASATRLFRAHRLWSHDASSELNVSSVHVVLCTPGVNQIISYFCKASSHDISFDFILSCVTFLYSSILVCMHLACQNLIVTDVYLSFSVICRVSSSLCWSYTSYMLLASSLGCRLFQVHYMSTKALPGSDPWDELAWDMACLTVIPSPPKVLFTWWSPILCTLHLPLWSSLHCWPWQATSYLGEHLRLGKFIHSYCTYFDVSNVQLILLLSCTAYIFYLTHVLDRSRNGVRVDQGRV